jgi:general secretion pathway protein G
VTRALRSAEAGFTLMEILVVIGIMALLVGIAVGNIQGIFSSSKENVARMFVQQSMKSSLAAYQIDVGDFPSTQEGLQALITAPAGKTGWRRRYIDTATGKVPTDPWQHEYQYAYPGSKNIDGKEGYDLWSMGPDGVSGTADDIGNWPTPIEGDSQK